jgi:cobalt-zinc-cadmium efflux system outer membrane protein
MQPAPVRWLPSLLLMISALTALGCRVPSSGDLQAFLDTAPTPSEALREEFQLETTSGRTSSEEKTLYPSPVRLAMAAEPVEDDADTQAVNDGSEDGGVEGVSEQPDGAMDESATVSPAPDTADGELPPPAGEEPRVLDLGQLGDIDLNPSLETPETVPAGAVTLDDLQQIALQCNPTLMQAAMAVQAAEARYVQNGLYPNPKIGYSGEDMGVVNSSGQQGMIFGQEVVTTGKLRLARTVAGYEIEQARHTWQVQQQRVLNDVRRGYYEVLLAQMTVEVHERLVRISEEVVQVNEKLRAALEVSRPVLLQSQIEANAAKLGLIQARKAYAAAWQRLSALIGQPEMPLKPLAGRPDDGPPEFTWEDVLGRLYSYSPELGRAHAGVERARSELARQRAHRWPNFEVGAGVKHDDAVDDTLVDVEVAVPLPIFNRNQGGIAQAEAAVVAAEREVQRVELDLQNRLATVFQRYSVARQQVEIYTESIIPDARESLKLTSTGYREGEFSYLDLLVAQTTYFDVSLSSLERLKELWDSSVQLDGLLLSGGLERVDSRGP